MEKPLQAPCIYLDFNASTPIAPEVADAMRGVLAEPFGNPSSEHWAGEPAKRAIEKARTQVAGLLKCRPSEIVFTSGGSEANNHALKGVFFAKGQAKAHFITTQVEHPAIVNPCRFLERLGATATYLPVDGFGRVDPDDVRSAITPETILISVMHANNEIGTIQPIPEIARIAREHGILFHTDAAQSVGKVATRTNELGVDLLSVAGHKLYGPKGVGALFVREQVRLEPLIHGAGHELGRRAGTENIPVVARYGIRTATARSLLGHVAGLLRRPDHTQWASHRALAKYIERQLYRESRIGDSCSYGKRCRLHWFRLPFRFRRVIARIESDESPIANRNGGDSLQPGANDDTRRDRVHCRATYKSGSAISCLSLGTASQRQ
jgi:cysteine desulfurase